MICSIKFLDKRFANEVRNLVGNDDIKFYSYLGNAIENEDFTIESQLNFSVNSVVNVLTNYKLKGKKFLLG